MPIHWDHVAGMNCDEVALDDFIERNLNFNALFDQPDGTRLLAEGVEEHFLRIVFRFFN